MELDEPFTKETYIQLLQRAYINMESDNVLNNNITNDYFRVSMMFDKQLPNVVFTIKVPHNLDESNFIIFILGVLSIKRLKYIIRISVKLYNGEGLYCFNYITNCQSNSIYYFKKHENHNINIKWNKIRKHLMKHFVGVNQQSIDAIIH